MRRISFVLITLVLGSIVGCGQSATNVNPKPAPSGGAMIRLPGNHGFVAIKTERPKAARGGRAKNPPTSIVAFFYQSDGATPMSPAPSDVVFKVGDPENPKPITLSPDANDPNRFASSPAQFPGGLQGTIHAKIDGENVQESFSAR